MTYVETPDVLDAPDVHGAPDAHDVPGPPCGLGDDRDLDHDDDAMTTDCFDVLLSLEILFEAAKPVSAFVLLDISAKLAGEADG